MPSTPETASFKFHHTMIRIKDPKLSLPFYTEILGMELFAEKKFSGFTLYFLGYGKGDAPDTPLISRQGVLELTHNHGTESDPDFKGYANGNTEPGRGFGHIAITADNIEQTCERLEKLGVPFKKKLQEGNMKGFAFVLDPDGYWVEILPSSFGF